MAWLGALRGYFHNRKIRRIHHAHWMEHGKDYLRIEEVLQRFRTAGGLNHDYQAYKLFVLWQLLLSERPSRILELGSGTSTAIFADYVRMYGGYLYSVDESSEWLENSRKLAAIDTDDTRFRLRQADKRIVRDGGRPTEIAYDISLKGEEFDFVLIDGPSLRVDGEQFKSAVNTNIFDLVEHAPPAIILVDIRAATVDAMTRRLSDLYHCRLSDLIKSRIVPDYAYFTEFRLRGGPEAVS